MTTTNALLTLAMRLATEAEECLSPTGIVRGLEPKAALLTAAAKGILLCESLLQEVVQDVGGPFGELDSDLSARISELLKNA
jgi:hypothetical protein